MGIVVGLFFVILFSGIIYVVGQAEVRTDIEHSDDEIEDKVNEIISELEIKNPNQQELKRIFNARKKYNYDILLDDNLYVIPYRSKTKCKIVNYDNEVVLGDMPYYNGIHIFDYNVDNYIDDKDEKLKYKATIHFSYIEKP